MLPEDGPLTDGQLDEVRARLTAYMEAKGLEPYDVARQIGVNPRGLADFLAGKQTGNTFGAASLRIARNSWRWLVVMRDADAEHRAPCYVTTTIAEKMIGVIKGTHQIGRMGAIVGPSGISKTVVCKAVELGVIPGSMHVELTQAHGRARPLALLIARRLGIARASWKLAPLMDALIEELQGSRRLIMVDEAHYLSRDGCQMLRDLHKQTGCPIVLVGTRDVLDTINDFNEFTGQFKRLFAYVFNITEELAETGSPLYAPDEIAKFCKMVGVRLTGDGLDFATELASILGWGGLGSLGSLLLVAKLIGGEKAINRRTLAEALRQMEGATGFERVRVRSKTQTARVAVAG